jgi:membrane carboxypeptidase/penicillin-binding protein
MIGANPLTRTKYGLNHVTQVRRQPGSSFKPFVYSVAVNNGYSPGYEISNEPLSVNMGGRMWTPRGGGTGGNVTMRYAIEKSINVVAVRTAMEISPIDKVASEKLLLLKCVMLSEHFRMKEYGLNRLLLQKLKTEMEML